MDGSLSGEFGVFCWGGGGGGGREIVKLTGVMCRFYEAQGFTWLGDFSKERPGKDIGAFEGAFLKMEL